MLISENCTKIHRGFCIFCTLVGVVDNSLNKYHIRPLVKASVPIWNLSENKREIWRDRAGGYGIQDPFGMLFIEKIDGDFYNVVGLPISRLYEELRKLNMI